MKKKIPSKRANSPLLDRIKVSTQKRAALKSAREDLERTASKRPYGIKLPIETIPPEKVPVKSTAKRQPKEDSAQIAFRTIQETEKRSES